MSSTSALYQHSPLPNSRSLRLIKILDIRTNIRCSIATFFLDSCPPYLALSYTWNFSVLHPEFEHDSYNDEIVSSYSTPKQITLNDKIHKVTKNLFEALHKLHQIEEFAGEYIWIDALCIDQDNFSERASQVLMMGDIYACASQVISWLGESPQTDQLDNILWLQNDVRDALVRFASRQGYGYLFQQSANDIAFLNSLGLTDGSSGRLLQGGDIWLKWRSAWASFFQFKTTRQWFYRVWVVQEVALAQKLVLVCGDVFLSLELLAGLDQILWMTPWGQEMMPRSVVRLQDIWRTSDRLEKIKQHFQEGGPESASMRLEAERLCGALTPEERWFSYFAFTLCEVRGQDATDKRDKIYAIIGMLSRALPANMANPIRPDYHLSVEEVFTSTTGALLQHLPFLWMLSLVEDRSRKKSRPCPPGYPIGVPAM